MTKSKHTPGPWIVWDGPEYVGGGRDLCIGAGKKWLANMDHRQARCPQIMESGIHDPDACDICSLDADCITEEQSANARLIAAAPELLEAVKAAMRIVDLWLPPAGNHNDEVAVLHKMADQFSSAIAKAEGTTDDQE